MLMQSHTLSNPAALSKNTMKMSCRQPCSTSSKKNLKKGTRASDILIAHDELDIPAGCARFKRGGGHGGHNGLRDIIPALGNDSDFYRLRIGIGHPGSAAVVSGYVLGRAPAAEAARIATAIDAALDALPLLLAGDLVKAQTQLHSFTAP